MSFFIIYPRGDKNEISIVELCDLMRYELSDYAVASRKEFEEQDESITYAKKLAAEHDKKYVGPNLNGDGTGNDYLD
jgi:hypothetical protein